jgi:hypothetical protein
MTSLAVSTPPLATTTLPLSFVTNLDFPHALHLAGDR